MATPYWRSSGTIVIYDTTHQGEKIINTHHQKMYFEKAKNGK
jgi:hypothetical protein